MKKKKHSETLKLSNKFGNQGTKANTRLSTLRNNNMFTNH